MRTSCFELTTQAGNEYSVRVEKLLSYNCCIYWSVSLCVSYSVSFSVSVCPSVCLSVCLSVSLSLSLSCVCVFLCISYILCFSIIKMVVVAFLSTVAAASRGSAGDANQGQRRDDQTSRGDAGAQ